MSKFNPSIEQQQIFNFNKKNLVISASAGSGKTTTMIEFISRLIEKGQDVKRLLVLTFTKAAASEMRERLILRLMSNANLESVQNQLDDLFTSDISTIHSFLEKVIKRNLSQFPHLEGFKILDEKQTALFKEQAFEQAQTQMSEQQRAEYFDLFLTMRDKNLIKEIIFKIEDFLNAQADKNKALMRIKNYQENFEHAKLYLTDFLSKKIDKLKQQIFNFPKGDAKVDAFLQQLFSQFNFSFCNLQQLAQNLLSVNLPRIPVLSGEIKDDVKKLKALAQQIVKFAEKLQPQNQLLWQTQQSQKLIDELLKLYNLYSTCFSNIKLQSNCLDFDDLELKSEHLLEDEHVLKQLQENYDYVFIDEYQDTNPVQEKIVKLISKKCKFVAIGDPKQGIYAFRNATSKIILKDSEDFENQKDGQTQYLSQNYRSDRQILQFVNHVFAKIMTQNTTGIDYASTSLLKGDNIAQKVQLGAVNILVAQKQKLQRAQPIDDYNIFDDPLVDEQDGDLEAQIVANKIEQLLASNFIGGDGKLIRVQPKDIAVLSRSRSNICTSIINNLRKKGIPFVSTLKTDLLSKAHIQLVLSLLNLCCDSRDEIALASFLLSPFACVDMDKLALLQQSGGSFVDNVFSSQDGQIKLALQRLEWFKNQCMFFGAKKALEKLFYQTEYFVYLYSHADENAVQETQSLLSIIGAYENDKDLPSLCEYLNSDISFSNISGQNAVTISSIHASKGLEYKIVFVVSLGKPLSKVDTAAFKISNEFGLSLMVYDEAVWQKQASLALLAAREQAKRQERIDEIMVLYVALTRAKCHLFITGSADLDEVEEFSQEQFSQYATALDLILSTQPQQAGADVEVIDEVVSIKPNIKIQKVAAVDENNVKKINNYLNFNYPYQNQIGIKQKASVTQLVSNSDGENTEQNQQLIEEGNAYHEALRVLDFENIKTQQDVENQLKCKKIQEKYLKILNFSLIFNIIQKIKPLANNCQIIKEKQFTMRLEEGQGANLVQGVVDLYLKGEKNILIDYKFTGQKNAQVLKTRYLPQLKLYKQAIEKAENIKIDKMYLVSIKYLDLIKI